MKDGTKDLLEEGIYVERKNKDKNRNGGLGKELEDGVFNERNPGKKSNNSLDRDIDEMGFYERSKREKKSERDSDNNG